MRQDTIRMLAFEDVADPSVAMLRIMLNRRKDPPFRLGSSCGGIDAPSICINPDYPISLAKGPIEASPLEMAAVGVSLARSLGIPADMAFGHKSIRVRDDSVRSATISPLIYLPHRDEALDPLVSTVYKRPMAMLDALEVLDDDASSFVLGINAALKMLKDVLSSELVHPQGSPASLAYLRPMSIGHTIFRALSCWSLPRTADSGDGRAIGLPGAQMSLFQSIRDLMEESDLLVLTHPLSHAMYAAGHLLSRQMASELDSLSSSAGGEALEVLINLRRDDDASVMLLRDYLLCVPPVIWKHVHDERDCPDMARLC